MHIKRPRDKYVDWHDDTMASVILYAADWIKFIDDLYKTCHRK